MWGDVSRCGEVGDVMRCGEVLEGDVGRCEEMWKGVRRCEEV